LCRSQSSFTAAIKAPKKGAPVETEKGVPLAPSAKDMKPWYSERNTDGGNDEVPEDKRYVRLFPSIVPLSLRSVQAQGRVSQVHARSSDIHHETTSLSYPNLYLTLVFETPHQAHTIHFHLCVVIDANPSATFSRIL
jgi:hypothetical protein